jgi:7,8-dihydroneopterin aldolase/epimerase/oxygenase
MNDRRSDHQISQGRVFVERLELRGFHGCFAHERRDGQMFEIDLELAADLAEAAKSDSLAATIDYGAVVALTRQVFCGAPRHLVEAAAFDIAEALLEAFPRIDSVLVRVGKLTPPIPENLRVAGVEIEVKRER